LEEAKPLLYGGILMNENKMSLLSGSLLWFGAAISIAEILTGGLIAPLGFQKGIAAILAGHLIGCALLFYVGLIGARSKTGAMESTSISFGRFGSVFFSVLNILQLIGWTAVMILSGANALAAVAESLEVRIWCLVIGALIIIWVLFGLKNVGKLNLIAVGALFVLCLILGITVFNGGSKASITETMSFGLALELSVAMPVSWLPLISDYTKGADKPVSFSLVSTLSYFIGSSVMYMIGLGAAIFAGTSDTVQILVPAGLGLTAMLIVILSTVTTTFLDVYSAGESTVNIFKKLNGKLMGVAACIAGTVLAIFTPIEQYENFLYLIGSVFVPMASIMIADFFINRNTEFNGTIHITNTILWGIGFILYRILLNMDTMAGSTVPVVIVIMLISIVTNQMKKAVKKNVS
jgi:putative hydroxymethylpyrimidine transporter CytX